MLIGATALAATLNATSPAPAGPAVAAESEGAKTTSEESEETTDERGNTVLARDSKVPSFDVSAVARFAIMLGEARQLTQPIAYGFGMVMRVHPSRAGSAHLGFFFAGGHLRAPELGEYTSIDDPTGPVTPRWQRLAMSDFAGGLSLRAPAGPIVFSTELGGGLVVGEFVRPTAAEAVEDELYESVDPTIRAGISIGAPFRNNHGVVVGLGVTHVFSGLEVLDEQGQLLNPFGLFSELTFGYQGWF